MHVDGDGDVGLFLVDVLGKSINKSVLLKNIPWTFYVVYGAGLEFRATLSWIEPPPTLSPWSTLSTNLTERSWHPTKFVQHEEQQC